MIEALFFVAVAQTWARCVYTSTPCHSCRTHRWLEDTLHEMRRTYLQGWTLVAQRDWLRGLP